jgi:hypothetical protein
MSSRGDMKISLRLMTWELLEITFFEFSGVMV